VASSTDGAYSVILNKKLSHRRATSVEIMSAAATVYETPQFKRSKLINGRVTSESSEWRMMNFLGHSELVGQSLPLQ